MSTYNQSMRNLQAFPIKEKEISLAMTGVATGDLDTGLTIPAGAVPIGIAILNPDNALTSSGAGTLQGKVGATAVGSSALVTAVKGKGQYTNITAFDATTASAKVYLTVGVAGTTAGVVTIKLFYI